MAPVEGGATVPSLPPPHPASTTPISTAAMSRTVGARATRRAVSGGPAGVRPESAVHAIVHALVMGARKGETHRSSPTYGEGQPAATADTLPLPVTLAQISPAMPTMPAPRILAPRAGFD